MFIRRNGKISAWRNKEINLQIGRERKENNGRKENIKNTTVGEGKC